MVLLVVVCVVLGVVLEQVEAVAKPLLVPVLKKPPPGPPKPPPGPPKTPPGPIYDFNRKISRNHKIVFFLRVLKEPKFQNGGFQTCGDVP